MTVVLFIIPVLAMVGALVLYRHNGKRELLSFDVVQFFYAFIISPLLFVWAKSFLFFLLTSELRLPLSTRQLFLIDSLFSVGFLYIFAFAVIHSLTKSFNLKKSRDPLIDLFEHSEYLHLWLSHLVIYIGGMVVITFLALTNIFFPIDVPVAKPVFYGINLAGVLAGAGAYAGVMLSDPEQDHFMLIMKTVAGLLSTVFIAVYFVLRPSFSAEYGLFWFSMMTFLTGSVLALFTERSGRTQSLLDKFKHRRWEFKLTTLLE